MSETSSIQRVGIVGAGFMGTGIAEAVAKAGLAVALYEPEQEAIERSRVSLVESLQRAVAGGKFEEKQMQDALARVSWCEQLEALVECDLVIEAVFEDPSVKGPLFRKLDEQMAEPVILASNTSSIPIAQLASWTRRADRVLGLHFFSPVPVMKLVEIVIGLDTSPECVELAERFVRSIGKTPIRTGDRSGFIVNMLLVPYLMAAVRMLEEGFASREDIDQGMKLGAGHPMGPLTLCDFIGLDVLYAVCDSLYEEFKRPEYAPPPLLKRMVVSGHHGRKSGHGFYAYDGGRSTSRSAA
jgi:3-hydroxybutyryl-CoA dehydrogenase